MFNHARGLWGYTGTAPDGAALTVQATGMGGPSAAIVCEELIALGARRLVRIGTCGALAGPALGELVAAESVWAADGASGALGARGWIEPDPRLTERLVAAGARPLRAVTTDLFYDARDGHAVRWLEVGAEVVEMEAAAVLAVAARRGAEAACLLAVTDVPAGTGTRRAAPPEIEALGPRLGELAYAALTDE